MKKLTQKATIEICKELRLTVVSFDPTTMRRTHSYGGLHPLQALAEVTHRTTMGERVLITATSPDVGISPQAVIADSDPVIDWEINNKGKGRCPFQIAQKWALRWSDILGEYRQ